MLHTSGFPTRRWARPTGGDRPSRHERMASWRLNWEPGTRYEYHPTAAHWVLAELIETVTGTDFRDAVARARHQAARPAATRRTARSTTRTTSPTCVLVGEPATSDELMAAFGVPELPATEVTDDAVMRFNEPEVRAVGVPGGGGFARAVDMATLLPRLLHGQRGRVAGRPAAGRDVERAQPAARPGRASRPTARSG